MFNWIKNLFSSKSPTVETVDTTTNWPFPTGEKPTAEVPPVAPAKAQAKRATKPKVEQAKPVAKPKTQTKKPATKAAATKKAAPKTAPKKPAAIKAEPAKRGRKPKSAAGA